MRGKAQGNDGVRNWRDEPNCEGDDSQADKLRGESERERERDGCQGEIIHSD